MNARLLRTLWSVVDQTPNHMLTSFDDTTLGDHLLCQVESQVPLSYEEQSAMWSYITSKATLIRDLAQS